MNNNEIVDANQTAREVALSLLQPSQRDLEHGLKLHRESLVIDSYGFAPCATVDAGVLEAAAEEGASAVEIKDLFEELSSNGMIYNPEDRRGYIEAFEYSGVDCIMQNAGEESNDLEVLIKRLARFTHAIDSMPEVLQRAVKAEDILAAKHNGKRCLYLTTNGVPIPKSFNNAEEGVAQIRTFFQLGVRMMHLTYNRRNLIGDGCAEAIDAGLSDFGRAVVKEMNRVGIIPDIAHSGIQTGLDAAKYSEKPVVISHAVCSALSTHCRAKTDELMRAVADTGGTMGICCIPHFVQGTGDIRAFLDHVEHAVKTVGVNHVTIGTDIAVRCRSDKAPAREATGLPRARQRFQNFWAEGEDAARNRWQSDEMVQSMRWSNWPLFTVGLVQRGYSDDEIQKIIGGNILRVAQASLD